MKANLTLQFWIDDNWYVGKLMEVPGVFSQGENLEELKENILEAYHLMIEDTEFETELKESQFVKLEVEL